MQLGNDGVTAPITDYTNNLTNLYGLVANQSVTRPTIVRSGIMHVRAATVQIKSGKMQEAIDIYNNAVVPAAKTQKGFQGAYLMADSSIGKALSITVWESEADLQAGEAADGYFQEQIAKFASVFAGPPTTEHYELSVDVSA